MTRTCFLPVTKSPALLGSLHSFCSRSSRLVVGKGRNQGAKVHMEARASAMIGDLGVRRGFVDSVG